MKRILTKLLAVLVPCLLVIGSIGFACMADEAEAETVDTTVETEQEQPEEQNDDAQNEEQEEDLPDSALPPSEPASDETAAADDKAADETSAPEETSVPEEDATVEGSDEEAPEAEEQKEEYQEIEGYFPEQIYAWADYDPSYRPAKSVVNAGSGLYRYQFTGNDLKVYQLFKDYFRQVANGTRTSTSFEITFELLGAANGFTAADLGVDAIVANGKITEEAKAKLSEKVSVDIQNIRDRILVECPFECYWYDKTASVKGEGFGYTASNSSGEWKIYLTSTGYSYSFPVAEAYASSTYVISSTQVNRALAASNKAKQIVAKYKNLSDYEKLVKYKEEICALVDYNHSAADNDNTPFGDPWQLIYVFDGDTSTDVVCEGYSKAFKYLCDLTDFDDNNITCILVSGNFQSSSGTNGGHMWNVVSFGNGMTYMVDVTNCDDGAIGQKDKLFLKKYTANSSTSTYSYKISSVTCYYTYYNNMFTIYRDATLDLADDSLVISPAINITSTCKGFDMTWDPVPGAQYYDVYRRTASSGWVYMGAVVDSNWYDYNLTDGTTYYFAVRAVDSNNHYLSVYNDQSYLEFVCVHTPVIDPAVEPTHDEPGLTEGSHCAVCGEVLVEQQEIPVLKTPITIASQPQDFEGAVGKTATFKVIAAGEGLTYQWQLKKGKSWANLTTGGATTATLSVKVDSSKNGKVYRCLITDANGEELASNEVSITVKQPSNAIKINTQPSDYAGAIGTMAKFTVVAEGEGLTYQWQLKKGSSWANLTSGGATTASMSIKVDAGKNGKVYRCVITDANGEMIATKEVTITVKEPSNAIVIVSQPESYDGPSGNTARFTVVAEGEGLSYQWQLKKGNSWADLTSGGATTATLSIKADYSRDGKVYRCVITDANGEQIISDEATITISNSTPPVPT